MERDFTRIVSGAAMLIVGLFVVSMVFGTMPASEHHSVTNESVTQDVGNYTQVSETYGLEYNDTVTVYNASGVELTDGADYEWNATNQSVKFLSTANTNDGASATISYEFDARPKSARDSIGTIGSSFTLGAVAVIVLVAALILGLIGDFGSNGSGGRRR